MRLHEGFLFSHCSAGIINMVLEVQMKVRSNALIFSCDRRTNIFSASNSINCVSKQFPQISNLFQFPFYLITATIWFTLINKLKVYPFFSVFRWWRWNKRMFGQVSTVRHPIRSLPTPQHIFLYKKQVRFYQWGCHSNYSFGSRRELEFFQFALKMEWSAFSNQNDPCISGDYIIRFQTRK